MNKLTYVTVQKEKYVPEFTLNLFFGSDIESIKFTTVGELYAELESLIVRDIPYGDDS